MQKKKILTTISIAIGCLLFTLNTWAQTLSVNIDRQQLAQNEILTIEVSYDRSINSQLLDTTALRQDFQILGISPQNRTQIFNGTRTESTSWTIHLLPKRTGKVILPSLNVKGSVSDAIEINVTKANTQVSTGAPLQAELIVEDTPTQVNEQLLVTLRITASSEVSNLRINQQLDIANGQVTQLSDNSSARIINGKTYQIIDLVYAVFISEPGPITIPSITFQGMVADPRSRQSFFGRQGKDVLASTKERRIDILEKDASSSPWFPAKRVLIQQKWSQPIDQFFVGEPVTRTITIQAEGQHAEAIPPLDDLTRSSLPSGLRSYPDQPQLETESTSTSVNGRRQESVAIVPATAGEIILPEIRIPWWNSDKNQWQESVIAEQRLLIQPSRNSNHQNNTPTETLLPNIADNITTGLETPTAVAAHTTQPWLSNWLSQLSLAMNILLMMSVVWLLFNMSRHSKTQDTHIEPIAPHQGNIDTLTRRLLDAIKRQDAKLTHSLLLPWARLIYGRRNLCLAELAVISDDEKVNHAILNLDRHLYSQDTIDSINFTALESFVARTSQQPKIKSESVLSPLYPSG